MRVDFIILSRHLADSSLNKILVSSANNMKWQSVDIVTRSLINKINNIDPNTDHWATPYDIFPICDTPSIELDQELINLELRALRPFKQIFNKIIWYQVEVPLNRRNMLTYRHLKILEFS